MSFQYDVFSLTDNRQIQRDASSRYYWLTDDQAKLSSELLIPTFERQQSFVFLNKNGTDSHYLLHRTRPTIDVQAIEVQTDRALQAQYDVVFISNGEPKAAEHYARLEALGFPNRLHWVKDVKGRNKAYKEAARVSSTPYFFAVFAKIEINPEFDFTFGCESWDHRHYVFQVTNPVNGLAYGHQAVILYNKAQVLANPGTELDFTMAQLYREIPVNSGIAHYNTSPKAAWRCAFREVLKLAHFTDDISRQRIQAWLTGYAKFGEYSIKGAKDALAFYARYKDDPKMLQLSYDWETVDRLFRA